MPELGLNIERTGYFSPEEIRETGAKWVRFPVDPNVDIQNIKNYVSRLYWGDDPQNPWGIRWLAVVDRDSLNGFDWANASFEDQVNVGSYWAEHYAQHFGGGWVGKWEIGNEPDGWEESSFGMQPDQFNTLLGVFLDKMKNSDLSRNEILTSGGLVTGQANYFDGVPNISRIDAVNIHPYGMGAPDFPSPYGFGTVDSLVNWVRNYHENVEFSEFGVNHSHFSEDFVAEYLRNMLSHLKTLGLTQHFCYSDQMVLPFGLIDLDGRRKLSYYEFQAQALEQELPFSSQIAMPVRRTIIRGQGIITRKPKIQIPKGASPVPPRKGFIITR